MTSYVPVIKNGAGGAILYVGLFDQSNTKLLKANPTIASGDFKVSIDGGALANLGTLPTVTPAAGRQVKITLSQAEVNGDNITIQCVDAAGAEWCDLLINLQTAARQIDDLAFPATSGRSFVVSSGGVVDSNLASILGTALTETAGQLAAGFKQFFNIASPTSTMNLITAVTTTATATAVTTVNGLAASVITAASIAAAAFNGKGDWNIGKTGYALSAAGVQAVWDALTSALTTAGSIGKLLVDNINATISSRLASASYTAPLDAAGTRAALGFASANADTQFAAIATPAQVKTQVVAALATDTYAEPGQGTPPATTNLAAKIGYVFKGFRNKSDQTSSAFQLYNSGGTVVDQKGTVSDDGTTFARGELATGP